MSDPLLIVLAFVLAALAIHAINQMFD